MAQNVVYLSEYFMWVWKKMCILLLLGEVLYRYLLQLSLGICWRLFPGSTRYTKIHRCSSPTVGTLHLQDTHLWIQPTVDCRLNTWSEVSRIHGCGPGGYKGTTIYFLRKFHMLVDPCSSNLCCPGPQLYIQLMVLLSLAMSVPIFCLKDLSILIERCWSLPL